MAKDKGQVRRVLQILSPGDQETLAILHDPPRMEELLRRQETLAEVQAAGLAGGVASIEAMDLSQQSLSGLSIFPAALDELAALPVLVRDTLMQVHLPALVAAPQEGMALTQLFQGLWIVVYTIDNVDYRVVYATDPQDADMTLLMLGTWASLEERLEEN